MWEYSEGDTKFLYAMKLVPSKDLGSTVHLSTIYQNYYSYQHYSLKVTYSQYSLTRMWLQIMFFLSLYKHLEHALSFLKCMVNEHIFINLVYSVKISALTTVILRLGK